MNAYADGLRRKRQYETLQSKSHYLLLINKKSLRSSTLTEIENQLKDMDSFSSGQYYILRAELSYIYRDISDTAYFWFQYRVVDINGDRVKLRCGRFEIVHIDGDKGTDKFISRNVIIRDITRDRYYTYKSVYPYPDFIEDELMPLLQKLKEHGGWEEYHMANGGISLYGENEANELYKENIELRNKLGESEKEIRRIKIEKRELIKEINKEKVEYENKKVNLKKWRLKK